MKIFKNILFLLAILLPIIAFADLAMAHFFAIDLLYFILIWCWFPIFILSLFLLFRLKIKFLITLFFGLAFIALGIYQILHFEFNHYAKIEGSNYEIKVYPHRYDVIKPYYLMQKTIVTKPSSAFFSKDSKIGLGNGFKVKMITETETKLILEIQTRNGKHCDTLIKQKFWQPKLTLARQPFKKASTEINSPDIRGNTPI